MRPLLNKSDLILLRHEGFVEGLPMVPREHVIHPTTTLPPSPDQTSGPGRALSSYSFCVGFMAKHLAFLLFWVTALPFSFLSNCETASHNVSTVNPTLGLKNGTPQDFLASLSFTMTISHGLWEATGGRRGDVSLNSHNHPPFPMESSMEGWGLCD